MLSFFIPIREKVGYIQKRIQYDVAFRWITTAMASKMIAWMRKNELPNTSENREYYVNYRLQDF